MTGDAHTDRLIVAGICAFLGLFVGSFLNVVIYRVPAGESVVAPRSRCPKCGTQLAALDNIPVLSWLILRAQCRTCGVHISARYPLIELGTAVLFGCVGWWVGLAWDLPAFLYLASIGIALSMIDLDTRRLPNTIVLPSYAVALVSLGIASIADHRLPDFGRACLGGAIAFGIYLLLALIYPAGMGFGRWPRAYGRWAGRAKDGRPIRPIHGGGHLRRIVGGSRYCRLVRGCSRALLTYVKRAREQPKTNRLARSRRSFRPPMT